MMKPDDKICLCFHVTRRKVENFIRIEKPRVASQLADCYGAGTGCGWCRPFLKKLLNEGAAELPSAADFAEDRATYVRKGKGTPPPGATPVTPPASDD